MLKNFSSVIESVPKDSWFHRWLSVWPLAESPKSYMLFSAMSVLGAALGRSVRLSQDFRELWPMLNLLLIGDSGIGKTTSLEIGLKLLQNVPTGQKPLLISGKATPEKLHEDLVLKPHAILYAEELAAFFSKQKYMEGMIPYITALLNYLPEIEIRTKKDDVMIVRNPSVTVIGGSTPEWLQEQLPDSATTGGFLARFLIVYERHKSQRIALPGLSLSQTARAHLVEKRKKVFEEFEEIIRCACGIEMEYDGFEAADVYSHWYNSHTPLTGHLSPFAARAGEFVQRMAMLLAVSRRSNYIEKDDIQAAIRLHQYSEERLQQVVVPLSVKGKLLSQVMKAIANTPMTLGEVCRAMRNYATSQEVQGLITSLLMSGDLVRDEDGRYRKT